MKTVAKEGVTVPEAVEQIDIGEDSVEILMVLLIIVTTLRAKRGRTINFQLYGCVILMR